MVRVLRWRYPASSSPATAVHRLPWRTHLLGLGLLRCRKVLVGVPVCSCSCGCRQEQSFREARARCTAPFLPTALRASFAFWPAFIPEALVCLGLFCSCKADGVRWGNGKGSPLKVHLWRGTRCQEMGRKTDVFVLDGADFAKVLGLAEAVRHRRWSGYEWADKIPPCQGSPQDGACCKH